MKRLIALLFSVLMVCAGNFALASTAANPPTQQPRTSQKSSNKQTQQPRTSQKSSNQKTKQKESTGEWTEERFIEEVKSGTNSYKQNYDNKARKHNSQSMEDAINLRKDPSQAIADLIVPTLDSFLSIKDAYKKADKNKIVGWWRVNFDSIKKVFENKSTSDNEKTEIIKIANSVVDSAKNQRNEKFRNVVATNTGLTKSISSNFIDNYPDTVIAKTIASVYQKKTKKPVTREQYKTIVKAANEAKNDKTVQDLENKLGELCTYCPICCQEAQKGNSATSPQQ